MSRESACREIAKRAFLEGYELGKGIETISPISRRVAERRFERWWAVNHPDGE